MPSLHVHLDWVDELPAGTVQDAGRTLDAIAFSGWIEFAEAIRTLTLNPKFGVEDRESP